MAVFFCPTYYSHNAILNQNSWKNSNKNLICHCLLSMPRDPVILYCGILFNIPYYIQLYLVLQTDIETGVISKRAERVTFSAAECNIDLIELDNILTPLRSSCTKDNIQNAKSWVLINIVDSSTCEFFSVFLVNR